MNKFNATVVKIESQASLHVVTFKCQDESFKMVTLELDDTVEVGCEVVLGVNPESVAVSTDSECNVSYINQIPSQITEIHAGELLSVVKLAFKEITIEALIMRESMQRLQLKQDDNVTAILKANDIYLLEVLSC